MFFLLCACAPLYAVQNVINLSDVVYTKKAGSALSSVLMINHGNQRQIKSSAFSIIAFLPYMATQT